MAVPPVQDENSQDFEDRLTLNENYGDEWKSQMCRINCSVMLECIEELGIWMQVLKVLEPSNKPNSWRGQRRRRA